MEGSGGGIASMRGSGEWGRIRDRERLNERTEMRLKMVESSRTLSQ